MPEHESEPTIDRKVPFRPAGFEIHDRVLADHPAGFSEHLVTDVPSRPGAVLPPAPTRHAPRESIAERLHAQMDEG